MTDATDLHYWCSGDRREREMERFRGDMMVESQEGETHKTAPKTVSGVLPQGSGESNALAVANNCKDEG